MSDLILSNNELVNKFFRETKLDFYYLPTVVNHLKTFIVAAISKGFTAKTTDIAEFSPLHRTTIGHFLSNGVWDEDIIVTYFVMTAGRNVFERAESDLLSDSTDNDL